MKAAVNVDELCRLGLAALNEGREDEAIPRLRDAAAGNPGHKRLWQILGLLYRAAEDLESALASFKRAAELDPQDIKIALGLAYSALDAGLPASALFRRSIRLGSTDPSVRLGLASALLAEEGAEAAIVWLQQELARDPEWLPGHWLLARLLWAQGFRDTFTTSLEQMLAASPKHLGAWGQLLLILTSADRYEAALDVIRRGREAVGHHILFDMNAAICLSETGALEAADEAFESLGNVGARFAVQRLRHELRRSRPERVDKLADPLLATADAKLVWPYVSIAWRLLGDTRWEWLEGDEHLVSIIDLGDALPPLDRLAELLRSLHWASGQPLEQSLRGGTQTDGALLSRLEPELRQLRSAITEAVKAHVAQLPGPDSRHPQLSQRRDRPVRFAGSWSVNLRAGHHANHVHPDGWISSALYVDLPGEEKRGGVPAGWLTLGAPDERLQLNLPPVRKVEPKPGRLVLFPSTMWHGTVPFLQGERLTVAFDVAPPR